MLQVLYLNTVYTGEEINHSLFTSEDFNLSFNNLSLLTQTYSIDISVLNYSNTNKEVSTSNFTSDFTYNQSLTLNSNESLIWSLSNISNLVGNVQINIKVENESNVVNAGTEEDEILEIIVNLDYLIQGKSLALVNIKNNLTNQNNFINQINYFLTFDFYKLLREQLFIYNDGSDSINLTSIEINSNSYVLDTILNSKDSYDISSYIDNLNIGNQSLVIKVYSQGVTNLIKNINLNILTPKISLELIEDQSHYGINKLHNLFIRIKNENNIEINLTEFIESNENINVFADEILPINLSANSYFDFPIKVYNNLEGNYTQELIFKFGSNFNKSIDFSLSFVKPFLSFYKNNSIISKLNFIAVYKEITIESLQIKNKGLIDLQIYSISSQNNFLFLNTNNLSSFPTILIPEENLNIQFKLDTEITGYKSDNLIINSNYGTFSLPIEWNTLAPDLEFSIEETILDLDSTYSLGNIAFEDNSKSYSIRVFNKGSISFNINTLYSLNNYLELFPGNNTKISPNSYIDINFKTSFNILGIIYDEIVLSNGITDFNIKIDFNVIEPEYLISIDNVNYSNNLTLDLGNIKQGILIDKNINVSNLSSDNLTLNLEDISLLNRLRIQPFPLEILESETKSFSIKVNSSVPGLIDETIRIKTNSLTKPYINIRITANITKLLPVIGIRDLQSTNLILRNETINLGIISFNQNKVFNIEIFNSSNESFLEIFQISSDLELVNKEYLDLLKTQSIKVNSDSLILSFKIPSYIVGVANKNISIVTNDNNGNFTFSLNYEISQVNKPLLEVYFEDQIGTDFYLERTNNVPKVLNLKNIGNETLKIFNIIPSGIELLNLPSELLSTNLTTGLVNEFSLLPNQSYEIEFNILPQLPNFISHLTINTNDYNQSSKTIEFRGSFNYSELRIRDAFDVIENNSNQTFSVVPYPNKLERTYSLSNTGNSILSINNIFFKNNLFTYDISKLTIAPLETVLLTITSIADLENSIIDSLVIETNSIFIDIFTINLEGKIEPLKHNLTYFFDKSENINLNTYELDLNHIVNKGRFELKNNSLFTIDLTKVTIKLTNTELSDQSLEILQILNGNFIPIDFNLTGSSSSSGSNNLNKIGIAPQNLYPFYIEYDLLTLNLNTLNIQYEVLYNGTYYTETKTVSLFVNSGDLIFKDINSSNINQDPSSSNIIDPSSLSIIENNLLSIEVYQEESLEKRIYLENNGNKELKIFDIYLKEVSAWSITNLSQINNKTLLVGEGVEVVLLRDSNPTKLYSEDILYIKSSSLNEELSSLRINSNLIKLTPPLLEVNVYRNLIKQEKVNNAFHLLNSVKKYSDLELDIVLTNKGQIPLNIKQIIPSNSLSIISPVLNDLIINQSQEVKIKAYPQTDSLYTFISNFSINILNKDNQEKLENYSIEYQLKNSELVLEIENKRYYLDDIIPFTFYSTSSFLSRTKKVKIWNIGNETIHISSIQKNINEGWIIDTSSLTTLDPGNPSNLPNQLTPQNYIEIIIEFSPLSIERELIISGSILNELIVNTFKFSITKSVEDLVFKYLSNPIINSLDIGEISEGEIRNISIDIFNPNSINLVINSFNLTNGLSLAAGAAPSLPSSSSPVNLLLKSNTNLRINFQIDLKTYVPESNLYNQSILELEVLGPNGDSLIFSRIINWVYLNINYKLYTPERLELMSGDNLFISVPEKQFLDYSLSLENLSTFNKIQIKSLYLENQSFALISQINFNTPLDKQDITFRIKDTDSVDKLYIETNDPSNKFYNLTISPRKVLQPYSDIKLLYKNNVVINSELIDLGNKTANESILIDLILSNLGTYEGRIDSIESTYFELLESSVFPVYLGSSSIYNLSLIQSTLLEGEVIDSIKIKITEFKFVNNVVVEQSKLINFLLRYNVINQELNYSIHGNKINNSWQEIIENKNQYSLPLRIFNPTKLEINNISIFSNSLSLNTSDITLSLLPNTYKDVILSFLINNDIETNYLEILIDHELSKRIEFTTRVNKSVLKSKLVYLFKEFNIEPDLNSINLEFITSNYFTLSLENIGEANLIIRNIDYSDNLKLNSLFPTIIRPGEIKNLSFSFPENTNILNESIFINTNELDLINSTSGGSSSGNLNSANSNHYELLITGVKKIESFIVTFENDNQDTYVLTEYNSDSVLEIIELKNSNIREIDRYKLSINNTGQVNLNINNILTNLSLDLVRVDTEFPLTLLPGQTRDIYIYLSNNKALNIFGDITVRINQKFYKIFIRKTYISQEYDLTYLDKFLLNDSINLGVLKETKDFSLHITNKGINSAIEILSIETSNNISISNYDSSIWINETLNFSLNPILENRNNSYIRILTNSLIEPEKLLRINYEILSKELDIYFKDRLIENELYLESINFKKQNTTGINLKSIANTDLEILDYQISYGLDLVSNLKGLIINPQKTYYLEFRFKGYKIGNSIETLTISYRDLISLEINTINLTVKYLTTGEDLEISHSLLDFIDVNIAEPNIKNITITNNGNLSTTLNLSLIKGSSNSSLGSNISTNTNIISNSNSNSGLTLPSIEKFELLSPSTLLVRANTSKDISIKYQSKDVSIDKGILLLSNNNEIYSVDLSGNTVAPILSLKYGSLNIESRLDLNLESIERFSTKFIPLSLLNKGNKEALINLDYEENKISILDLGQLVLTNILIPPNQEVIVYISINTLENTRVNTTLKLIEGGNFNVEVNNEVSTELNNTFNKEINLVYEIVSTDISIYLNNSLLIEDQFNIIENSFRIFETKKLDIEIRNETSQKIIIKDAHSFISNYFSKTQPILSLEPYQSIKRILSFNSNKEGVIKDNLVLATLDKNFVFPLEFSVWKPKIKFDYLNKLVTNIELGEVRKSQTKKLISIKVVNTEYIDFKIKEISFKSNSTSSSSSNIGFNLNLGSSSSSIPEVNYLISKDSYPNIVKSRDYFFIDIEIDTSIYGLFESILTITEENLTTQVLSIKYIVPSKKLINLTKTNFSNYILPTLSSSSVSTSTSTSTLSNPNPLSSFPISPSLNPTFIYSSYSIDERLKIKVKNNGIGLLRILDITIISKSNSSFHIDYDIELNKELNVVDNDGSIYLNSGETKEISFNIFKNDTKDDFVETHTLVFNTDSFEEPVFNLPIDLKVNYIEKSKLILVKVEDIDLLEAALNKNRFSREGLLDKAGRVEVFDNQSLTQQEINKRIISELTFIYESKSKVDLGINFRNVSRTSYFYLVNVGEIPVNLGNLQLGQYFYFRGELPDKLLPKEKVEIGFQLYTPEIGYVTSPLIISNDSLVTFNLTLSSYVRKLDHNFGHPIVIINESELRVVEWTPIAINYDELKINPYNPKFRIIQDNKLIPYFIDYDYEHRIERLWVNKNEGLIEILTDNPVNPINFFNETLSVIDFSQEGDLINYPLLSLKRHLASLYGEIIYTPEGILIKKDSHLGLVSGLRKSICILFVMESIESVDSILEIKSLFNYQFTDDNNNLTTLDKTRVEDQGHILKNQTFILSVLIDIEDKSLKAYVNEEYEPRFSLEFNTYPEILEFIINKGKGEMLVKDIIEAEIKYFEKYLNYLLSKYNLLEDIKYSSVEEYL